MSDCVDVGAVGRGKELLLVHEQHEGGDEARALDLQRLVVDLQQQIDLRLQRHLERVLLDRRVPLDVRVGLDRRLPHRVGVDGLVGLRDADRLPRDRGDVVLGDGAAAREAPRAVDDDAHAEAVVLGVDDVLDAPVAGEDELVAVAIDADVGVRRAGLLRSRKRGIGQIAQFARGRKRQEHVRAARPRGGAQRDHRLHETSAVNHGHNLPQLRTRSRMFEVNAEGAGTKRV